MRAPLLVVMATVVVVLAGCGESPSTGQGRHLQRPSSTKALDSIAVLGHSGATGTQSDPRDPARDARENSWATGENPEVESIYLRLLADHPALKGHNYNAAANGTAVDSLVPQLESVLATADPLPDVVLIQSIDNDMSCDGTDGQNYRPYAAALDAALTRIEKAIPDVEVFFVSQWASAARYAAWAATHEDRVRSNSTPGPCQLFAHGRLRPAGVRSTQRIFDGYWAQVVRVCAAHPGCFTDGGAEQAMVPTDADFGPDLNHLSIAGQHQFAELAWAAFPDQIKQQP